MPEVGRCGKGTGQGTWTDAVSPRTLRRQRRRPRHQRILPETECDGFSVGFVRDSGP